MKLSFTTCVLFSILAFALGCGNSNEAIVSGTVLVDGAPLPEGEIIFEEVDKSRTPGSGAVKDGKYSLKVVPGSKIVRISASRPARKIDPVMGAAAREQMIRDEYNKNSTLKAEIQAGEQKDVDFQVKAIP